jgi:succinyl-diaminopimelate desuccinylase
VSAEVVALAEALLRIESVTGNERKVADFVAQWCGQRGLTAVRAGDSVTCLPRALDKKRATVALLGHLDTVPVLSPNPVRREGDQLFGPGASDMKAADAVILTLCAESVQQATRHNLVGVLYAGEEGPFVGSGLPAALDALALPRVDLAVCMEPTDNAVELGCLGTLHARVTFAGRRAHSARPWQGDNAIHKLAPLLARLTAFGRREVVYAGLPFFEVMNATLVEFRGARNVIPDRCVLNVNYRFAPDKSDEQACADVLAVVAGEGEVEFQDICPGGRVCADNALLRELEAAGGNPPRRSKQAWTDVGRLSRLGIDAVNFGPGRTDQAHQAGEWVSVAEVEKSLQALRNWLFR